MEFNLQTFPVKASPQDYENWKKAFEKKHKDFTEGQLYDWLEENMAGWAEKGCNYLNLLKLFIEKEILGERTK